MLIDLMAGKPRRNHGYSRRVGWTYRNSLRRALHWLVHQNELRSLNHKRVSAFCDLIQIVERSARTEVCQSTIFIGMHPYLYTWRKNIDVHNTVRYKVPEDPVISLRCAFEGTEFFRSWDSGVGRQLLDDLGGWNATLEPWSARHDSSEPTGTEVRAHIPSTYRTPNSISDMLDVIGRRQRVVYRLRQRDA